MASLLFRNSASAFYRPIGKTGNSHFASAAANRFIRATAVLSLDRHARMASQLTHISTKDAAQPAGPYSQAVKTPSLIFVSGQIPADPAGNLVEGSIGDKTDACCRSVKAVLEAAGSGMDKVVKVNVFLADMADFAEMNASFANWFTSKPARSTVAVRTLPKNVPVEIECIALP